MKCPIQYLFYHDHEFHAIHYIDAALERGADLYLTGEIGYHRFFGYEQRMWLASIGHYESERFTPNLMRHIIGKACPELPTVVYELPTSPVQYL